MRVNFVSTDPLEDPLITSAEIPERLREYFVSNAERSHHHTQKFEYLEQRYVSRDCCLNFLDIFTCESCTVQPEADEAMLTIVHMFGPTVPCELNGFGDITICQGFAYLFYLPPDARHQAHFSKGHFKVIYCCFSPFYLDNVAKEHAGIAELLQMFQNESPLGLIEKAAPINSNMQYQMWLVQQCEESPAFRESHLKARCLDLVLEYVKQSRTGEATAFTRDSIQKNEKVFAAKRMIDEHDNGKLSIACIARKVGLNESQLKKIFRETFRTTIGKYQCEARLARTSKLLVETGLYISEIALRVGYQDESSLIRAFKKHKKITPQKYRINAKNNWTTTHPDIPEMPE